jgi:protein-disulfide isomerase
MAEKNNNPETEKKSEKETASKKSSGLSDEHWENIIAIIVVLLLITGAVWWVYGKLHPTIDVDTTHFDVPIGTSPVLSAVDGGKTPVVVVQFSDFGCSYCGKFSRDDFPQIKKDLIETGKVSFVYKQFLLSSHPEAYLAAEASVCAKDQGKFWEYHDTLYAHQTALAAEDLERYAKELGLDEKKFHDCISTGLRSGDVDQDMILGRKLGVTGTPTFFFNGRMVVGALSAEEFAAEVAKETKQ